MRCHDVGRSARRVRRARRTRTAQPPGKALVLALQDRGYESPSLDRLRRRLDPEQAQATLEQEIVQEIAAALGRTAAKLDHALLRLELAGRELAALGGAAARPECAARADTPRSPAPPARHELVGHPG